MKPKRIWCTASNEVLKIEALPTDSEVVWTSWDLGRPIGVKRITMRCPVCGRRLRTSVEVDMDGLVFHRLPKHKYILREHK